MIEILLSLLALASPTRGEAFTTIAQHHNLTDAECLIELGVIRGHYDNNEHFSLDEELDPAHIKIVVDRIDALPPGTTCPPPAAPTFDVPGYTPLTLPTPAGTTPEQWVRVRRCESTHNYGVVSSHRDRAGEHYRGAWQFKRTTWDGVARHLGRVDLVGVDADRQPAEVQDMMAYTLWVMHGWGQWECRS